MGYNLPPKKRVVLALMDEKPPNLNHTVQSEPDQLISWGNKRRLGFVIGTAGEIPQEETSASDSDRGKKVKSSGPVLPRPRLFKYSLSREEEEEALKGLLADNVGPGGPPEKRPSNSDRSLRCLKDSFTVGLLENNRHANSKS